MSEIETPNVLPLPAPKQSYEGCPTFNGTACWGWSALACFALVIIISGMGVNLGTQGCFGILAVSTILGAAVTGWRLEGAKEAYRRKFDAKDQARREEEAGKTTQRLLEILQSSRREEGDLLKHLESADWGLKQAREDFDSSAFSPFWDSIESVTGHFASFGSAVASLGRRANSYYAILEDRDHTFPPFPVDLQSIPDPKSRITELAQLVRKAQQDFQFANIWEHRRTRGALVKGFASLGDALSGIESVVGNSIGELEGVLASGLEQLEASQRNVSLGAGGQRDDLLDEMKDISKKLDE